ncbi:MAG: DUF1318 domain-containing protein [Chthoniobacterales bacterium]
MKKTNLPFLFCAAFFLFGCKNVPVDLTTSSPLKVDIDMRLDVYNHNPTTNTNPSPEKKTESTAGSSSPEARRRNRLADIQTMKNNRIVGEGHDGLLAIRNDVPGEYGEYVHEVVREENNDRTEQMKQLAEEQKVSLADIQKKQGELWRDRAFKGELIEVPVDKNASSYKWIQKGG